MRTINKLISSYNFNAGSVSRIKYIVIHYVGALGGAKANCEYYAGGDRGASAHYFVGFDGEIWQSVEDANIAWHCGASSYKHAECRNANSIGVELCVRKENTASLLATDKDWYFEDATVEATVELTRYLMDKYNVPASNVIRHYDVTGKICPNPYVYNTTSHTWDEFKQLISGDSTAAADSSSDTTAATSGVPYMVRVDIDDLNIRTGAGTNYAKTGEYTGKGTFTITEEKAGTGSTAGWGKLKSGAGWISLDYCTKITDSGSSASSSDTTAATSGVPYMVRVDIDDLNIRTGAGTNYAKTGEYTGKGTFTITEEKAGTGSTAGWGKLKSGAGWISLDYCTKITDSGSSASSSTATASTTAGAGTDAESTIWAFLSGKGLNDYAVAGIMGNLYAESGLVANNLQNTYNTKLGMTDAEYTTAVDDGSYTNFVNDSAGYGLAQWTYYSRKQALYDYAKAAAASIGNLDMQLAFLWQELQGYTSVMATLKAATSVRAASDAILTGFEKPADQSETVQKKRAAYGQTYYDKYAGTQQAATDTAAADSGSDTTAATSGVPYMVRVDIDDLNIRTGAGTNYAKTGEYTGKGTFTITEEKAGTGSTAGWGKLKSGAGWISLDYCTKLA